MNLAVAPQSDIRPPRALAALIKKDLDDARTAVERAGMPYYIAAGEKLEEARGQMSVVEFNDWVRRSFKIQPEQARHYIGISQATKAGDTFTSIKDYRRRHHGHDIPTTAGGVKPKPWFEPIKKILGDVNVDALRQAHDRATERELERKLAIQLIDIGFRALAPTLHPDKGGSREAMTRLNNVRDRLRRSA